MGSKQVVICAGVAFLAIIACIIITVATSLKKLESGEVGIQYNTYTKTLNDEPFYEGLHLGPPGFHFITFPSVFKTLGYSRINCLNYDGVPITISVSFQYRVRSANLTNVVAQFQTEESYIEILKKVGSTAVHDSCSAFTTAQFQSERGRFQEDLTTQLSTKFNKLHCDVNDLQVNDIARPSRYENAIRAKESAREDIEVAGNEQPRALTEANTFKREAEAESRIIINLANTDASILLNRAYADAQGILNEYIKEAESYKSLKESTGINNEGFLSYMGVRAIAEAKNPVYVGMRAPAETSFGGN